MPTGSRRVVDSARLGAAFVAWPKRSGWPQRQGLQMNDDARTDVDGNYGPPTDDEWGIEVVRADKRRALRGVTRTHSNDVLYQLDPDDVPGRTEAFVDRQSSERPVPVLVTIAETGEVSTDRAVEWLRLDGIEWDAGETPGDFRVA